MAKNKISEFSSTPSNNTDIAGINIAEGCAPSGIDNAIRELMAQLKDQQAGTDGDNFVVGGNATVTGTLTVTGASTFTGIPSGPTAAGGTNTTQLATTAFVTSVISTLGTASTKNVGLLNTNVVQRTADNTIPIGSTWSVVESAGVLYFAVSGVNKAKLDASGNLTVSGNVTAYGTI